MHTATHGWTGVPDFRHFGRRDGIRDARGGRDRRVRTISHYPIERRAADNCCASTSKLRLGGEGHRLVERNFVAGGLVCLLQIFVALRCEWSERDILINQNTCITFERVCSHPDSDVQKPSLAHPRDAPIGIAKRCSGQYFPIVVVIHFRLLEALASSAAIRWLLSSCRLPRR